MKKNNFYLLLMLVVFGVVAGLMFVVFSKFLPFFSTETVYMCKSLVASVSYKQIPPYLSSIILYVGFAYALYVGGIISLALIKYQLLNAQYRRIRQDTNAKIALLRRKHPFLTRVYTLPMTSSGAFSLGFFKRNIYISSSLTEKMSLNELEAVVLHEYKHIKDFDSLTLFLAFVIETTLTFLPSMREFTISMRIDREIEADRFAVSLQQTNTYVLTSLKKFLSFEDHQKLHFIPRFAPADLFDARIAQLVKAQGSYQKQISRVRLFMSLISFCVLSYLALTPVHAAEILIDGKTSVMACSETSPQCLAVCEAGASYLIKHR